MSASGGRRSWREVRRRQVGRRLGGGRVIGEEGTESTLRGGIGGGVEVEGRRVGGCGRGSGGRHAPPRIHLAVLPHTISLPRRLSIRKGRSMEGLGSTTGCTLAGYGGVGWGGDGGLGGGRYGDGRLGGDRYGNGGLGGGR